MLLVVGIFLICFAANWHPVILFLGGITLICAAVSIKEYQTENA